MHVKFTVVTVKCTVESHSAVLVYILVPSTYGFSLYKPHAEPVSGHIVA